MKVLILVAVSSLLVGCGSSSNGTPGAVVKNPINNPNPSATPTPAPANTYTFSITNPVSNGTDLTIGGGSLDCNSPTNNQNIPTQNITSGQTLTFTCQSNGSPSGSPYGVTIASLVSGVCNYPTYVFTYDVTLYFNGAVEQTGQLICDQGNSLQWSDQ